MRLSPVTSATLSADDRELIRGNLALADRYLSGGADAPALPAILGLLAHHPRLAASWLSLSSSLLEEPVIEARDRELLILRVGWLTQCDYIWVQHVRIGLAAGLLSPEAVAAGTAEPTALTLRDRMLLRVVDQLVDAQRIDDRTWAALATEFDERQLLEVLFVIGSYTCLAMVVNAAGLVAEGADVCEIELPERED